MRAAVFTGVQSFSARELNRFGTPSLGIRVIRAFVRIKSEGQRFGAANADLTATALRVNRVFALAMPALMAILNLSSVAVLWFGGRLVSEGSMPIGNLTAFRPPSCRS